MLARRYVLGSVAREPIIDRYWGTYLMRSVNIVRIFSIDILQTKLRACLERARRYLGPYFDHFVGAVEQRQRHGEAERLGGLEIGHQLELGRQLHWKIVRPATQPRLREGR